MVTNEQSEPAKRSVTIRPMHIVISLICILIFAFVIFRIWATHRVKTKLDAIRAKELPVTLLEWDEFFASISLGTLEGDAGVPAISQRTAIPM